MRTYYPEFSSFLDRARPGARLPVVLELSGVGWTPASMYRALRERFGRAILLESGKAGRYSYVCVPRDAGFSSAGRDVRLPDGSHVIGDPFEALRELLRSERIIPNERLRGFCGGYVGYFAYDMARHIERLPATTFADPAIEDCRMLVVESFCEIDHETDVVRVASAPLTVLDRVEETYRSAVRQIDEIAGALANPPAPAGPHEIEGIPIGGAHADTGDRDRLSTNLSRQQFEAIVRRAKEYIRAGDIFQVNLSLRHAETFDDDPLELYRALRQINPAPYMALLELDGLAIVSASPELLVRVRDRVIETRPIAGTRPRGATEEEDERMARKLAANEKERAEHLMLVDLERNDIGRVASYGTVRVDEFMAIERYSHVIHIVSNIRGELADGCDTIDAVRACFPGGTITGAPKVRSMEIIEELEPHRRGVYTGSIGWLGFDGSAELNIAIRTIVVVDGIAYAQAGAGIVADSEPEHEYRESIRKAEAALAALRITRERRRVTT